MIKKVLLIAALGVGIGILVYFFIGTISIPNLQNIFTQAEATWTGLPSIVKVLITFIPSVIFGALMTFMAWTKNLAMKETQQVKQKASQQINQLKGEKGMLEKQVKQSATTGVEELVKARDEAQTLVSTQSQEILGYKQQIRDIQQRHLGEISSLQARLDKYEPKERVVIK